MAEKKPRVELDDIVRELVELKQELGLRFADLKKKLMPGAVIVLGLIGIKIGFKIMGMFMRFFWDHRFLIALILLLVTIRYNLLRTGNSRAASE